MSPLGCTVETDCIVQLLLDLRKALTSVNHHPEEPSLQSLSLIRVSLEGCVGPASQLRLLSAVSPPL